MVTGLFLRDAMATAMAVSAVELAAESAVTVGGASDHLFRRLFLPAIWPVVEAPGA